jgi:ribose transport system permease protein
MRVPRNYRFWRQTGRNANVPPPAPQRKGRQGSNGGTGSAQTAASRSQRTAHSHLLPGISAAIDIAVSAFLCAEYSCGGNRHVTIVSSTRDRRGRLQLQSKRANIRDKNEEQIRDVGMGIRSLGQQGIVFAVFAALFAVFAVVLPGFLTTANMLTLLQNVAVLGILGLAMAIVVIGRGIDISLIAALAVPPGLVLQMVQDGHSLPSSLAAAFALTAVFGLVNGWLIAYAEVPSLFTTLASGLFLAGLGQAALFKLDVVQWSPGLDGFERLGQGNLAGIPMPIVMFALCCIVVAFFLRRTRLGAYIYAIGDNPNSARVTGIPTRPVIVLQYVAAAMIGCFAGLILAASVNSMPTRIFNSTLIYDVILVVVLGGIGLSGGRGGVLNVVIGTLLIGTMLNGMTIMDVSYSGQNLIKGVVLLVAVIADSFLNPRNEETAQQGDI